MASKDSNDLNREISYRLPRLGAETVRPILIITSEPVKTVTVIRPKKKKRAACPTKRKLLPKGATFKRGLKGKG